MQAQTSWTRCLMHIALRGSIYIHSCRTCHKGDACAASGLGWSRQGSWRTSQGSCTDRSVQFLMGACDLSALLSVLPMSWTFLGSHAWAREDKFFFYILQAKRKHKEGENGSSSKGNSHLWNSKKSQYHDPHQKPKKTMSIWFLGNPTSSVGKQNGLCNFQGPIKKQWNVRVPHPEWTRSSDHDNGALKQA